MNPAPPKPPSKNADRKAMSAYWSELRRWSEALKQWEADLDARETQLKQDLADLEKAQGYEVEEEYELDEDGDVMECGCTTEDAEDGCDCPVCEKWRSTRAQGMMKRQQEAVKAGDEIQWLEELWQLPDKRRKK